jgi:hypothetical protein
MCIVRCKRVYLKIPSIGECRYKTVLGSVMLVMIMQPRIHVVSQAVFCTCTGAVGSKERGPWWAKGQRPWGHCMASRPRRYKLEPSMYTRMRPRGTSGTPGGTDSPTPALTNIWNFEVNSFAPYNTHLMWCVLCIAWWYCLWNPWETGDIWLKSVYTTVVSLSEAIHCQLM